MSKKLLEEQVGQQLLAQGLTIACAESCTGGLLTSRLTDIAGSSAYVMGSVVSYTNRIKETLEHNRFATVIYTTKEDLSDPEPMLAAKDDEGHWRLYHMATAGNLGSLFRGSDLDDARFVVRKGQERMAEIRGMMRRKAEAGVKP